MLRFFKYSLKLLYSVPDLQPFRLQRQLIEIGSAITLKTKTNKGAKIEKMEDARKLKTTVHPHP